MVIKRGEIWLTDFSPVKGSEQRGIRPSLIISNDIGNKLGNTITALPLTSQMKKKALPINVFLPAKDSGLKKDSLILCGHIRTVDKLRLINKVGKIATEKIEEVEDALKLHLGML